MNEITRRNLLKALLGGIQAAGAVVLARAVPLADAAESAPPPDLLGRADRLAEGLPASPGGQEPVAFANGGFANGGGGGFRNSAFRNGGGGGAFRNGGFANGGGGGGAFRNGAFRNY